MNTGYILVVNGPNMNMLGVRQPEVYGTQTLDEMCEWLQNCCPNRKLNFFQSNIEGEIVTRLNTAATDPACVGVVLNAAAYTHTSVAIADAVAAMTVPVVEVHMSNVHAREDFRRRSLIAPYCMGCVSGFGALSYFLAIEAVENVING